jgi:hypothetical protein
MMMEVDRGSNRSHSLENSLWKRRRARRNVEYNVCEDMICLSYNHMFIGVHL